MYYSKNIFKLGENINIRNSIRSLLPLRFRYLSTLPLAKLSSLSPALILMRLESTSAFHFNY